MKTTLNKIRDCSPCASGWAKLLKSLNKTKADDEPVTIIQILDANGLDDALWCLRGITGRDREIRHYAGWCATQVQHLLTDPRSTNALDVAERFADGLATEDELSAAEVAAMLAAMSATMSAARSATMSAARSAAWAAVGAAAAAARSAAWAAAEAAAWAAAASRSAAWAAAWAAASRSAARSTQEKKLRELCALCDQNPVGEAMIKENE